MARKTKRVQEMERLLAEGAGQPAPIQGLPDKYHGRLLNALEALHLVLPDPPSGAGLLAYDYLDRAKEALVARGGIPPGLLRTILMEHMRLIAGLIGPYDADAAPADNAALWRLPVVMRATGLSRSTIRRLELGGGFPRRVKLSGRSMGWRATDILGWLKTR